MRQRELVLDIGDRVFLKFSPMKGVIRFGKKRKLSPLCWSVLDFEKSGECCL